MKINVLIENTKSNGFLAEHGLCFLIEYKDKKYLIDSGASDLFIFNATKMKLDLKDVDKAFLSHAHYDHSGGYELFFNENKTAKVYLQKIVKDYHYYKIDNYSKEYIGIPKGILDKYNARFEYINGSLKVDDGIYILCHNSDELIKRAKHTHMYREINGKFSYDDFSHEQIIIFEEDNGLVCFNSCSHAGVDISIEEIKRSFLNKRIKAYLGGFHMMGIDGVDTCAYTYKEIDKIAKKLKDNKDTIFFTGRCTGRIAYKWLKESLKDQLQDLYSGKEIII